MIRSLFERAFVVIVVLLFCQAPLFIQQYEMRLSGHVLELRRFVQSLEKSAAESKKSLPEYIRKFLGHKDRDIANQGKLLEGTVERYKEFDRACTTLQEASIWTRPFIFVRHLNSEVAKETAASFKPGLAMTMEALLYAIMGLLLSSCLLQIPALRRSPPQS